MVDYVPVSIRKETLEKIKKLKKELKMRSYSDLLEFLIDYYKRPIIIEASDKVERFSKPILHDYRIIDAFKRGESILFNVYINSKEKKIYVSDGAVIVGNYIDVSPQSWKKLEEESIRELIKFKNKAHGYGGENNDNE